MIIAILMVAVLIVIAFRVSMTPTVAATLVKKGISVNVEKGAGAEAKFRDVDFINSGAKIVDQAAAYNSGTVEHYRCINWHN